MQACLVEFLHFERVILFEKVMAASGGQLQSSVETSNCVICREVGGDMRTMSCNHTYCRKCVAGSDLEKFDCQLCNDKFVPPLGGVRGRRRSLLVEKRMEMLLQAGHTLPRTISDSSDEGAATSGSTFCETHQTIALNLYCMDCKEAICKSCQFESHQSHDCVPVKAVERELRAVLTGYCSKLVNRRNKHASDLEEIVDQRVKLETQINELENAITQSAERLKQQIDSQKQHLLDTLATSKCDWLDDMQNVKQQIELRIAVESSTLKFIKEIVSTGTDAEVAKESNTLRNQAQKMIQDDDVDSVKNSLGCLSLTYSHSPYVSGQASSDNLLGSVITSRGTDYDEVAIVIDNGSHTCKAGFAGDDIPGFVVPSVIGWPVHQNEAVRFIKDSYIGVRAQSKREMVLLQYPVKRGSITNWDTMEKVWQYVFNEELRVAPYEYPVLLTGTLSKSNWEKLAQVMFERFNIPAMYIADPGFLSLLASGRTNGFVIGSGDGVTNTTAVYEDFHIEQASQNVDVTGSDLTGYLADMLANRGCALPKLNGNDYVREVKEQFCFVSLDYQRDSAATDSGSASISKEYELPDGRVITVREERFRCPEAIFEPSLIGKSGCGIHQVVHDAIVNCDPELHRVLLSNVVLTGGSTLFPGFVERFSNELSSLAPTGMKVNVIAPPNRKYTAWIGGSILASLSTFKPLLITRQDYNETGPSVVQSKCG